MMKKIGLLSDTHGYLHPRIFEHFKDCDEIWHAGDIGTTDVLHQLEKFKPLRAVFGNIDGQDIRKQTSEDLLFTIEGVSVLMTHIGGYPGKYNRRVFDLILKHKPKLFICGHSHILKVIPDPKLHLLHINPGAAGIQGWHQVITLILFEINGEQIQNLRVVELGNRTTPVVD